MLRDRRVLLEQELKRAHDKAAEVYLSIVIDGAVDIPIEYEHLRNKISDLKFDLNVVNQLIYKGHK